VCGIDGWKCHDGNYSDYVHFSQQRALELAQTRDAPGTKRGADARSNDTAGTDDSGKPARRKRRFPYRKIEDLERDIAEKEAAIRQLEAEMIDPQIHRTPDRIREVTRQHDALKGELAVLYEHWEEAAELNS
jgi:ATP-binding cassette subfamily F protein 3